MIMDKHCNLEMSDKCYGCVYYGTGDVDGCKLTIEFYNKHHIHTNKEYKNWILSNGRIDNGHKR